MALTGVLIKAFRRFGVRMMQFNPLVEKVCIISDIAIIHFLAMFLPSLLKYGQKYYLFFVLASLPLTSISGIYLWTAY
jgi:hypothetical protein